MSDIHQYAQAIHRDVAYELSRANDLATQGFYTEAVLRLGRAVECSLYNVARELEIDVTNRGVKALQALTDSIRGCEVNIIRKRNVNEVRALANTAKRIGEAIADLIADPDLREGELNDIPRANEQLFRELVQLVDNVPIGRRLRQHENLLRGIQKHRNRAAHAPVDGKLTEFTTDEYQELLQEIEQFLAAMASLVISERARKVWASGE